MGSETGTQPDSTVDRIDAALDQLRRDAMRRVRQAAREANGASDALGAARRVVVLLHDEDTGRFTTVCPT